MAHIQFTNVDLQYPIREHHGISFKEFLVRGVFRKTLTQRRKTVHALKDISFQVETGERIGIIGLNGAGKSTLLRTIAGIFPIAHGQRVVEGSICSLFDIAVGFEPDATGIQNIFYRGYLQGETPQTIAARLPEIAAFSELNDFLHLPIRCYSTGMVMRLAFSVATSSEPEILLVDEVFSAGDLVFQKKAQARMQELLHRARIVVLVGHDLAFLQQFCTRVLWLHQGTLIADGKASEIIPRYVAEAQQLRSAA